ncbi:hypothetical protein [Frondihabitans peucedani]|uniref:Uncharacterized protein n=1 Tax=Frondihabitans peucedani TaxID=598626 RepID=A0ABP8E762_9MICO
MARMSPQRPTDRTDVTIGFLGAFAALFLVVTVVCEVTGRPALTWALILLALVVALALELRHRSAIVRRQAPESAPLAGGQADRS